MRQNLLRTAVVLGLFASADALAQDQPGTNFPDTTQVGSIPFDFLPPGARSLGLGGAFAAVADDATAAEANPAGQTILARPELSIHGRNADYQLPFYDVNALDAEFAGAVGQNPFSTYDDDNNNVSFASFVYPFERFVLSAYYHHAGALEAETFSGGFQAGFIDTYGSFSTVDAEQDSFGLSAAFRVSDLVSIGASIKHSTLEIESVLSSGVEDFRDLEQFATGLTPAAAAAQITDFQALIATNEGDDSDITWNAGILFNPNGRVSIGLVYKEGGEYDVDSSLVYVNQLNCNGVAGCTVAPVNATTVLASGTVGVELPDIFSVGLAVRPTDTWLISLQADRVDYSGQVVPTSFIFGRQAEVEEVGSEVQFHAGAEKTFLFDSPVLGMNLLSVRAGMFSDRDNDGYREIRSRDTHYTFGLGTVIAEKFQIDLAREWSDANDNFVLSAVYRF